MSDKIKKGESGRVNKYNLKWQIVRVRVKDFNDVSSKLKEVLYFYEHNDSRENLERVLNWAKMTKLSYRYFSDKELFDKLINYLEKEKKKNDFSKDSDIDFESVHTDVLEGLYKDLLKRKYDFQYHSVPKSHIEFMKKLEAELAKRGEL